LSRPFAATVEVPDLVVQLTMSPARAGVNDLHLYFFEAGGGATADVDAVEVTAAKGDIPARRLAVTPVTPSHVSVYGASLPSAGTWTIQTTVVRAGTPSAVTFEVLIR
jgi:hypothetical protein